MGELEEQLVKYGQELSVYKDNNDLNNSQQHYQQEKQQQDGHLMDFKRSGASTTI
ncbi:unnamed protein product [Meloidogyne enterolobii]|uniref:Uncharacterized protein n=1 Tax=Meloidogyne enterolobii TaxID=390850 RepID=A0ACB0ZNP5_MELEN